MIDSGSPWMRASVARSFSARLASFEEPSALVIVSFHHSVLVITQFPQVRGEITPNTPIVGG